MIGGGGKDKILGLKGDDILDGGNGNDKFKGGRGSDTYILGPGKDRFLDVKLKHGDSIEIGQSIDLEITFLEARVRIVHDDGMTLVDDLSIEDLTSVIDIA